MNQVETPPPSTAGPCPACKKMLIRLVPSGPIAGKSAEDYCQSCRTSFPLNSAIGATHAKAMQEARKGLCGTEEDW